MPSRDEIRNYLAEHIYENGLESLEGLIDDAAAMPIAADRIRRDKARAERLSESEGAPPDGASSNVSREALEGHTKAHLAEMARELDIEGRSSMNKGELVEALLASG